MSSMHIPQRFILIILAASLLLPALPARAQGKAYAAITTPDTAKFPVVTTFLNAFDDQGNFLSNLQLANISVLENGHQITPDRLDTLPTPLSLVLAINSDPTLGVRDNFGMSRYAKLEAVLSAWAGARPADSTDKFALAWNGGIVASRLSPADWRNKLDAFDPVTNKSTTGLGALAYALDAAQEAESGPGIKKSILLISPHLGAKDQSGLSGLIDRAKQAGVRVYVWITDSQAYQTNPGALALKDLALSTGGSFATFTGNETMPDLESWFSSLRSVYQVTYNSQIRTAGPQSLSVQVSSGSQALTSPAMTFTLDLQPPTVTLLSAPIQIVRQNPNSPFDLASFKPTEQQISVLVEFPDGRRRAVKRTTLFVDGEKIAENTTEPFNQFTWNLSGYGVSNEHSLQVEVEDVLGLSQKSAKVPVEVTVIQPPGGMAGLIMRNSAAVTISIMILAGAVVLGIVILGGRRGLASISERRKARAARLDPVTQPVPVEVDEQNSSRANPFPWLRRKEVSAPAYLARLAGDGDLVQTDPIPLNGREITFGTDPTQAMVVLSHASVSHLHARLRRAQDDTYTLLDQDSTAGTWVNYELIPQEGRALKHWDVINFGHLSYRFVLAKPPSLHKPTITPTKDG